jgi:3-methyladenine DNA glycosylase Tag
MLLTLLVDRQDHSRNSGRWLKQSYCDRTWPLFRPEWAFAPERTGAGPPVTGRQVPASKPESKAMAKELKRRGFRFIGPTTAYA